MENCDAKSTDEGCRARFTAAVHFIASYAPGEGEKQITLDDSVKLTFYGLYKQATEGARPPDKLRPDFYDLMGRAKFDAWGANGQKSNGQAMVDYVRLLDKLHPPWRSWRGIPAHLRGTLRSNVGMSTPLTPRAASEPAFQSAPTTATSSRTADSGIYGDFTAASVVRSPDTSAIMNTSLQGLRSAASGAGDSGDEMNKAVVPDAGASDGHKEGAADTTAASQEGSERSSVALLSSSAKATGATAPRTTIRWSMSPNYEGAREVGRVLPTFQQRLTSAQLEDMCGNLAQFVDSQRAELSQAQVKLAEHEAELSGLHAAYSNALQEEAAPPVVSVNATPQAVIPMIPQGGQFALGVQRQRGLVVLVQEWLVRLLWPRARFPIAMLGLLLLAFVALRLRRRRGGG
jgi:diazepam-binding inhibitor (GABA receptor modulating acyl-CoA-binding protein)